MSFRFQVKFQMDGAGKQFDSKSVLHSFYSPTIDFISLGGVPKQFKRMMYLDQSDANFTGCINRFILNNEAQPLLEGSSETLMASVSGRVVEGCGGPMGCISPPCDAEPFNSTLRTVKIAVVCLILLCSFLFFLLILAWIVKKRWWRNQKQSPSSIGSPSRFNNLALVSNSGHLLNKSAAMGEFKERPMRFGQDNLAFMSQTSELNASHLSVTTTNRASSVQLDPLAFSGSHLENNGNERRQCYDLDNASSIAPSDIDVSYHYRCYREGINSAGRRKNPQVMIIPSSQ